VQRRTPAATGRENSGESTFWTYEFVFCAILPNPLADRRNPPKIAAITVSVLCLFVKENDAESTTTAILLPLG
jgi:hypothetical protein